MSKQKISLFDLFPFTLCSAWVRMAAPVLALKQVSGYPGVTAPATVLLGSLVLIAHATRLLFWHLDNGLVITLLSSFALVAVIVLADTLLERAGAASAALSGVLAVEMAAMLLLTFTGPSAVLALVLWAYLTAVAVSQFVDLRDASVWRRLGGLLLARVRRLGGSK